jgi:hypothetical protein
MISMLEEYESGLRAMRGAPCLAHDESVAASIAGAAELVRRARTLLASRVDLSEFESPSSSSRLR